MSRKVFVLLCVLALFAGFVRLKELRTSSSTGAPPYGEALEDVPDDASDWITQWKRPEGPAKVALQVGHLRNEELPDELSRLRGNTGSSGGGKWEWEVNLSIAEETAKLLRDKGIHVEVLPATVPPRYWADVFVAIHADGSTDRSKSGFKIAAPWRDLTGNAGELVSTMTQTYHEETGFSVDDNITRNMRGYYAFSFWRYEHAVHPMTTSAIIETGFLTNPTDQKLLIHSPEISAKGIAEGILLYLNSKGLF